MSSFLEYIRSTLKRIKALVKKHPYLTTSLVSLAVAVVWFSLSRRKVKTPLKLSYLSDFMEAVRGDLVKEITTRSKRHLEYRTKDGTFLIDGSLIPKAELFKLVSLKQIVYKDMNNQEAKKEASDLIVGLVCFLASIGFSAFLILKKTISENYKFNDTGDVGVRFEDVYGLEKPKMVLQETIDYLSNSQKYQEIGCRLRRGIIFYGPPGTGKTMLAKAMAGESNSKFISSSASQFCEMYVGVGPKRIRQLFSEAKKHKSAIIFIDQIDALGKKEDRQSDKERNNTLNQLLVQMDGFVSNSRIVVIAATNRIQMIDSALLRSGRFDLKLSIPLPNQEERRGILSLHLSKKPSTISQQYIRKIANQSEGMCGADLQNLSNEAAYKALRKNRKQISAEELQQAFQEAFRKNGKGK